MTESRARPAKTLPETLLQGYYNFLRDYESKPQFYRCLAAEGQKPEIMVIGCCDSRAAPEIIFQTEPGDIFVTRNIANQVPPYQPDGHFHATSAALEYAVKGLGVKHILVLGHSHCGGIQAALDTAETGEEARAAAAPCCAKAAQSGGLKQRGRTPRPKACATAAESAAAEPQGGAAYDFIGDWMQLLKPAARAAAANALMTHYERQQALEQISLRSSIENLRSFPWIKQAEKAGLLALHAAWFDIASAELWLLNEDEGHFCLLPRGAP